MEPGAQRPMARMLFRKPLTARRAGRAIALSTLLITIAGGIAMRFADHQDFGNVWLGLWWSVQTVTTVGYGDVVPKTVGGRVIAAVVMLSGIGFVTVVTAAITAALVESVRRRLGGSAPIEAKLDEINARLERLEASLRAESE